MVEDALVKTKASADYPFQIGGHIIHPVASLALQNFRFLRSEQDGPLWSRRVPARSDCLVLFPYRRLQVGWLGGIAIWREGPAAGWFTDFCAA